MFRGTALAASPELVLIFVNQGRALGIQLRSTSLHTCEHSKLLEPAVLPQIHLCPLVQNVCMISNVWFMPRKAGASLFPNKQFKSQMM